VDPPEEHDIRIEIENDIGRLPEVVEQLEDELRRRGICDETEIVGIGVALREALANAIYHGNLEVSSVLLDDGGDSYDELARVRRRMSPYGERRVVIDARYRRGEVTYTVSDEGPGFDPAVLPDPIDPANLERVHGRGLMIIRAFMDEVRHNERGNVITMLKRRRTAP
jgi:anti-sigma regulatory factor (Ser/Thr protein kinase)